jgi:hypothetical protein
MAVTLELAEKSIKSTVLSSSIYSWLSSRTCMLIEKECKGMQFLNINFNVFDF